MTTQVHRNMRNIRSLFTTMTALVAVATLVGCATNPVSPVSSVSPVPDGPTTATYENGCVRVTFDSHIAYPQECEAYYNLTNWTYWCGSADLGTRRHQVVNSPTWLVALKAATQRVIIETNDSLKISSCKLAGLGMSSVSGSYYQFESPDGKLIRVNEGDWISDEPSPFRKEKAPIILIKYGVRYIWAHKEGDKLVFALR